MCTPPARRRAVRLQPPRAPRSQRGVVLIIALIMLVVVSMLATLSMRNAASGETVAGNVRTTQLASQAAEIALRYCENAVVGMLAGTPPATAPELLAYNATPKGTNPANWDKETTDVLVIPSESVNQTGSVTFLRSPECMVERVPVVTAAGALNLSTTFMITARGFGPEVAAADASRTRPVGTEVWLQSTIELD